MVRSGDSPKGITEAESLSGDYQEIRSSIEIDAPIGVVWEVLHDPATYVEAIDWVYDAWVEGGGELREGSIYVERAKYGLREKNYHWTVTAFEPPTRSTVYHKSGEMETEAHVVCEAINDEKTRFTQILRFRAFPTFRPLGYVLERTVMKGRMQRQLDEIALPNIKRITERRFTE